MEKTPVRSDAYFPEWKRAFEGHRRHIQHKIFSVLLDHMRQSSGSLKIEKFTSNAFLIRYRQKIQYTICSIRITKVGKYVQRILYYKV